ncbi:MAG: acyl dehydratase [Piscirickettsiaceae bacterium CG_4_10_14_3_um_filter_44_349]|uniref:MaoC family dehydratase n=1 Tax=Shewanella TaxID=22 RepID=UPI000C56F6A4|nr:MULTISPECIES: MaoC family dehydratase [Shewanella]NCQ40236.1 MaoC family dehydratase [Shewanella vesiculosa]PIP99120.1 MAG: acyl dehydratase [Shewanella sp. CG18_big_fil_WC_8_21_14_2_50_42_11]PIX78349.1 MAG: acyl dehydratase [Piscirickettsiaceae bacterium CG_4_10_14_3_um_filter_44_349]
MTDNFKEFDIHEIEVGMKESSSHTITDNDVVAFAEISGDKNPAHLDEEFAASTRFKKRIAHGLMSASYFSALFGTKLPGRGCVYVSQNLNFKRPVYIGDEVIATIEVVGIDVEKRRVFFSTTCKVKNKVVIDGEAEMYIPPKG